MNASPRILITGNLGYIGPWVTRRLRACYPDADLVGVDTGYFAHCLTSPDQLPETLLNTQHFVDLRACPARLLDGVDAVVHLAAISNDPMSAAYETVTLNVNYHASLKLAKMARRAGVRSFVFASSCSVYGSADDRPRTEQSELAPLTAYAKSKVLTEEGLRGLAGPGFRVTCLRFATACGMSPRLRLDLVLNDFVASALSTGRITVLSDGSPWRPLINVKDMARAIEWAVERKREAGGDYLVVNAGRQDWNFQVRDLAKAVATLIPGTEVSINQDAPPDKRSYQVDFSLFRRQAPDYQPVEELPGTIDDLIRGLQLIHFRNADFRASSFMRLRVIADLRARGVLDAALEWTTVARAGAQYVGEV